ncbi:MAG: acyl-CoA desaturase, partial [Ekhidna sp.]
MEVIIPFFLLHWYSSLFFQTFFLHRYASHQMFTMSPFWEKTFFILTWIFQGSNYLSAYGYGVMHRMHHAFADTEDDPHSPKYDETIFKMMWKTKTIYSQINKGELEVDKRFTDGAPQWKKFDFFARSWVSRLFWGSVYVGVYFAFADAWWLWLLLPAQFLLSPIHGAIINW